MRYFIAVLTTLVLMSGARLAAATEPTNADLAKAAGKEGLRRLAS